MRLLLHHLFIALLCGTLVAGHTPALIHHASCDHASCDHASCDHAVERCCDGRDHAAISNFNTTSCACAGHGSSVHHNSSPYQESFKEVVQDPENDSHHHDSANCLICQSLTGLNAAILIGPSVKVGANFNEPAGSTEQVIDWFGQHISFLARGPPVVSCVSPRQPSV